MKLCRELTRVYEYRFLISNFLHEIISEQTEQLSIIKYLVLSHKHIYTLRIVFRRIK